MIIGIDKKIGMTEEKKWTIDKMSTVENESTRWKNERYRHIRY